MRVVFREQIKITGSALEELIVASGQDLRQASNSAYTVLLFYDVVYNCLLICHP